MTSAVVFFALLLGTSTGAVATATTEASFSTDPATCVVSIFSQGGGAPERYLYRIFGDGRVEGNRYNGLSQVPARTWSSQVDPAELAAVEGDALQSGLIAFSEEKQRQAIAASGRKHPAETDMVNTLLTFNLQTKAGSPETHQVLLEGGSARASDYPEVPEHAAALRLLRLLKGAQEPPLIPVGNQ